MIMSWSLVFLCVTLASAQLPPAKQQPYQDDFISFYRKAGEPPEKYHMPKLNEEDERSLHFPRGNWRMKCDVCGAITYQIEKHLKEAEEMYKKEEGPLRESVMLDTFDTVCKAKFWDKVYGVKPWEQDRTVLRISGPGSNPSITKQRDMRSSGARWGLRFRKRCNLIIGDAGGEYDVYDIFKEHGFGTFAKHFCTEVVSDCKRQCKPHQGGCAWLGRGVGMGMHRRWKAAAA